MTLTLNGELGRQLKACLDGYAKDLNQVITAIHDVAGPSFIPDSVHRFRAEFKAAVDELWEQVRLDPREPYSVSPKHFPILKRALLTQRRSLAKEIEQQKEDLRDRDMIEKLDRQLAPYMELMQQPWFATAEPARVPRLTDYFSVQRTETGATALQSREYDEKFHTLMAPSLFLGDLAYFRHRCSLRDVPVAVAFVDIDDFKVLNTAHRHERIDRDVLPRFMEAVEAFTFGRGFAYRQGGDEYLILLPNACLPDALRLLDDLRQRVAALEYFDIPQRTHVSVGVCVADGDCHLTDAEVKERANRAASFAKDQGKNRVAYFDGNMFREDDLRVFQRTPS